MRNNSLFAILLLLILMLVSALVTPLDADTGYYLGIVNRVFDGEIPYRDFGCGYPPAFIVALLPVRAIAWSSRAYVVLSILLCVLCLVASSVLMDLVVRRATTRTDLGHFAGWIFLIVITILEGINVYLEPFVCLFGLLAVYLALARRPAATFASGLVLALAVFAKQYGLLFAPAVAVYLLVAMPDAREKLRHLALLLLGFALGAAALLALLALCGIDPVLFLNAMTGRLPGGVGYGHRDPGAFLYGLQMLLVYMPFLPVVLITVWRRPIRRAVLAMALTGLLFSLGQLVFRAYAHYYILTLPFALLLLVLSLEHASPVLRRRCQLFVMLGYILAAVIVLSVRIWVPHSQSRYLSHMEQNVERMTGDTAVFTPDSARCHVFCFSLNTIPYYVDPRLAPTELGFGFGDQLNIPAENLRRLRAADVFLVDTVDILMLRADSAFSAELDTHFDSIPSSGDVLIFKRNHESLNNPSLNH